MTKFMRIMLVAAVAVLLFPAVGAAQAYTISVGNSKDEVNDALFRTGLYLGEYDGLHCWVGKAMEEHKGKDAVKQVALVDDNLVVQRSLLLPDVTRWCDVLCGTMIDGRVSLLLVDSAAEGLTMLFSSVIDLATMAPADDKPLLVLTDSLTYGNDDICYVWGSVSANRRYVGRIVVVEYPAKHQYTARATLYDNNLQELWYKDYALSTMEHLAVTDDGRLVTLGYENDESEAHFIFNLIGQRRASSYDVTVPGYPIRQLELAGIVDDRLMALGLIVPSWKGKGYEMLSGGVVGLAFGIDEASMMGVTMRPFLNEDLNILLNERTRVIQRWQEVDLASVSAVTTTSYGAVLAVGRNWRADVVQDNGTMQRSHTRMGLHMVAVDTAGNIRWVRNVRRNDIAKSEDMLSIGFMSFGDTVAIVKKEHTRTPVVYDVSREARPLVVGSKANTAIYTIAPDGEVGKTLIEQRKSTMLLRALKKPDGSVWVIEK